MKLSVSTLAFVVALLPVVLGTPTSSLDLEKRQNNNQGVDLNDPNGPVFCNGKTLTGGIQRKDGTTSCSPTVQGDIPGNNRMTSTIITSPANAAVLQENQPFTISVNTANLITGFFSDPTVEYNLKPQELPGGVIKGHQHVTVQNIGNAQQPPDAAKFDFFLGLNDPAQNGVLTADVSKGLPAGNYRICTMSGSFTHQPLVMPVAQRGSQDDCIRIAVGGANNGGANNNNGAAKNNDGAAKNNNGGAKNNNGGKQRQGGNNRNGRGRRRFFGN